MKPTQCFYAVYFCYFHHRLLHDMCKRTSACNRSGVRLISFKHARQYPLLY